MSLADIVTGKIFDSDANANRANRAKKAPPDPPKLAELAPLALATPPEKKLEVDPGDLHRMIDRTLLEIDQARPDWTGWRRSLTPEQRDRMRDLEAEIDLAALAGDRRRLERALASYQDEIN